MIKIDLKSNSENFTREAVGMYCREPSSVHRKAVSLVLLVQAAELMLKQKLANHSHLLLYENVDSPKMTVSMTSCLRRLSHIGLAPGKKEDSKVLDWAIKLRNDIVHHEFETSEMAIKDNYVRLCGLLHELRSEIYGLPLFELMTKEEIEILRDEKSLISEVHSRCELKLKQLSLKSKYGEPFWCGWCANKSVELINATEKDSEPDGQCLICGAQEKYTTCESCTNWFSVSELEEYRTNNRMCLLCLEATTNGCWVDSIDGKGRVSTPSLI